MIHQQTTNIYRDLSKKYDVPHQVVEVICNHPFKFANSRISDNEDNKSIMFSYLFKLKLKKKYGREEQRTVNIPT